MYIKRTIEEAIRRMGESFPCIVIYGARQVGKSTTLQHMFGDEYTKVTLDDINDRTLAARNPGLFLETYGWPLIIDEIQKAPQLLDEIKKRIDEQRLVWLESDEPRQLMYVLSGSNRFELQQGISDSLAGRCGILEMASFSQAEKQNSTGSLFRPEIASLREAAKARKAPYRTRKEIFAEIFRGGMPDICTGVSERDLYFNSYVNTYIEKDIRQLISAGGELAFRNFLSLLALRTAQEFHPVELANAVGIDSRTCKKWLSILETSGIIYLLQPYMANISRRIIKSPKLYFYDSGLLCYLLGIETPADLQNSTFLGAVFETMVLSEYRKTRSVAGKEARAYYYRDTNGNEIDLLTEDGGILRLYEIKAGKTMQQKYLHQMKKTGRAAGVSAENMTCIYGGTESVRSAQGGFLSYRDAFS